MTRIVTTVIIPLVFSFVFLAAGIATISDYNVNWDEPDHFVRGQAYLRYFLTGKKTYNDLPLFKDFHQAVHGNQRNVLPQLPRYSIYQSSALDAGHHLVNDNGHPPLGGILASLSNYVLFQQLGLVGDVESYHLFILFISSVMVFLIGSWVTINYGVFAGTIASLSLVLHPMLIAESHNNIKDPIEATFFSLFLLAFYQAVVKRRWQLMIIAAVAAGLALATKFNILFAPLIVLPWFAVVVFGARVRQYLSLVVSLFLVPVIAIAILFVSWPFLWQNPLSNFLKIVSYYKEVGIGQTVPASFFLTGFNTYPLQWILFTTPLPILILAIVGIFASVRSFGADRNKVSLLFLLWFMVPIIRVSVPGAGIYGGLRQIMEFIPAMAILSGIGAGFLAHSRFFQLAIILAFFPITLKLISLHPNQNLYFNQLIGGLTGAARKDFPGWGSTLGNPYLPGVKWLNQNAEPNARLTLALGLMTTIPPIKLRDDIVYDNTLKSVTFRQGEYIMDLTYYAFQKPYYDAVYPERFLTPLYQIKVDGIPILNIWKNDALHTKPGFLAERDVSWVLRTTTKSDSIELALKHAQYLTKLELSFEPRLCRKREGGFVVTSLDGQQWTKQPEGLLEEQVPAVKKDVTAGNITHLLAAVPARYLKIEGLSPSSCLLDRTRVKLYALRDIVP